MVDWQDNCGHDRNTVFQDAGVGMPNVSISKRATEKDRTHFDEYGGELLHKPTGEVTPIVARMGVYFVQMRVPNAIVNPSEGFQRPGP